MNVCLLRLEPTLVSPSSGAPISISALDLFKLGMDPPSSHTVDPMRASGLFVNALRDAGALAGV